MFYKGLKYFLSEYFSQNFRNDSLYLGSCNLPITDILFAKCLILADGSKYAIALSAERTKGAYP